MPNIHPLSVVSPQAELAAECVRAGKKVERWLDVLARYLAKYYRGKDLEITAEACANDMVEVLRSGDLVYLKGSRGIRLEKILDRIVKQRGTA